MLRASGDESLNARVERPETLANPSAARAEDWVGEATFVPIEPRLGVRLEGTMNRVTDFSVAALAVFVPLLALLTQIYPEEGVFGTARDYLTAFLLGAASPVALKALQGTVGQLWERISH